MSRIQPATVVVDATPMVDRDKQRVTGVREPLKKGDGNYVGAKTTILRQQPLWKEGRKVGFATHFVNAAARSRCEGDIKKARPNETVLVPIFAGIPARVANEIRADIRRDRRKTFLDRMRETFALRKANKDKE